MNANHMLALRVDGTVWGWGRNDFRQLGDGTTTNRLSPVQVVWLTRVVQVWAGFNHGLAVRDDGTVWAWGHNGLSQLGDGTTTNRPTPVPIAGIANITHVSAGGTFSLALACHALGVPFYIAAPSSTIDRACPNGAKIPIEERKGEEVSDRFPAWNPAFDVTPAKYITGFITERGVSKKI